jgi:pimeloyl-ACP methyl ester carboxylesterase
MPLIDAPNGQIDTIIVGDGPNLVVLVHASAAGHASLKRLAKATVRSNMTIAIPALYGYGETRIEATDPLVANISIVQAALNHFDAESKTLMGHSMGGLAAVNALDARVRADALVLYDPILIAALDNQNAEDMALLAWDKDIVSALHASVAQGEPERGVAGFVEGWNEVRWPTLPQATRDKLTQAADLLVAETASTAGAQAPTAAINSMGIPVTIVRGANSPPLAHRMASRFAALLDNVEVVDVEGAGHMGPVIAPHLVAPVLHLVVARVAN